MLYTLYLYPRIISQVSWDKHLKSFWLLVLKFSTKTREFIEKVVVKLFQPFALERAMDYKSEELYSEFSSM